MKKKHWGYLFSTLLILLWIIKIDGHRSLQYKLQRLENEFTYRLTSSLSTKQQITFLKDSERFIAHAGGEINNEKYTESLEALDYNYQQGLRYFELDLNMTRDQKLVAVHIWRGWKIKNHYNKLAIPTHKEFMHMHNNKYTRLDSAGIRKWFVNHPKAFLVTDKINNPSLIAKVFPFFKKRVMMELFSWEAVKKAQKLGYEKIIIFGDLLLSSKDINKTIQKYKIKRISLSRRLIPAKLHIIKQLRNQGVKIFLYHANYDGFNDLKTFQKLLPFAYGLYVNHWSTLQR